MVSITSIIGGLFILTLVSVLVIGPMLQDVPSTGGLGNATLAGSVVKNQSGQNLTTNVTIDSGGPVSMIFCNSSQTGYRVSIKIPLIFTEVHVASLDICPPSGYNGDFLLNSFSQLAGMIGFIIVLALLGLVLGFVTSGQAGQSLSAIGVALLIFSLFIGLLAANAYIFLAIPVVGTALIAVIAVGGGILITLGSLKMLSGSGMPE